MQSKAMLNKYLATPGLLFSLLVGILQFAPVATNVAEAVAYQSIGFEFSKLQLEKGSKVSLGALATRTQGGKVTRSGLAAPWTLSGTDSNGISYSFQTSGDKYTGTYDESSTPAWGYEGKDFTNSGTLNGSATSVSNTATYQDQVGEEKTNAIYIHTVGSVSAHTNTCGPSSTPCYATLFGPQLYSETFTATSGQGISFEWAAAADQDDYEFYAFLVKLSNSSCTSADTGFGSSGDNSLLVHSRGGNQNWTTTSVNISSSGCFRFRFVSGSYDSTGGKAVGSDLYIGAAAVLGTAQNINFNQPADIVAVDAAAAAASDFTITASTNATGNTISFTSLTPSVCTVVTSLGSIDTATVNIASINPSPPKSCTIVASAGARNEFTAANDVSRTFQIKSSATKPVYSGGASLSGSASVCNTLTISEGSWNTGGAAYTSEVTYIDFNGIDTITASSIALTAAEVSKRIQGTIVKRNSVGWETATTTSLTVVDATFSGITASDGTLSPAFSNCGTSYSISTSNATISLTPTATDNTSSITVDGAPVTSGSPSSSIALNVGSNAITVESTKSSKVFTVTITITRSASSTTTPTQTPCLAPTLTSISPNVVPLTGGRRVEVSGSNLTSSLYLDNNSVNVSVADSTKVVFVTPIRGKGIATVRIDGCAGSASITLEFDSSPRSSAYTPDFGSTEGGTRVSITGIQLDGASVKVGGVDGKIVSNSSTSLIFTTPTGLPGVSSIIVTTSGGTLTLPYTYFAPPEFLTFTTPYLQQGVTGTVFFGTKNTDTIEILSGRIPVGMNFSSPLGTLSGTPSAHGSYTFVLLVKNKVGEKSTTFNLVVDKPIPDDMILDLPMKFNDSKEADAYQKRFKDFLELAREVAPAKFIPFVFLEGGSQVTTKNADVDALGRLRHNYVKSMIASAPLATLGSVSNYCSGNTGRVRITLSWNKSATDFTACANKASIKPVEPATPEKPTPPSIEESILDVTVRVYFSMGSIVITPTERRKLNELVAKIQSSSTTVISISGFAQPTRGTELSDPALSKKRAMAVSNYLKGLGVEGIGKVDGKGRAKLNIASSRYVEVTVKPAS